MRRNTPTSRQGQQQELPRSGREEEFARRSSSPQRILADSAYTFVHTHAWVYLSALAAHTRSINVRNDTLVKYDHARANTCFGRDNKKEAHSTTRRLNW